MKSRLQDLFKLFITEWFPNLEIKENYRPIWLNGLELDFFVPEWYIGFEVQGIQHFEWCPNLQCNLNDFLRQKENDQLKVNLCDKNHVTLIYITYKGDTIDNAIKRVNDETGMNLNVNKEFLSIWHKHVRILKKLHYRNPRFTISNDNNLIAVNNSAVEYAEKNKLNFTKQCKKSKKKKIKNTHVKKPKNIIKKRKITEREKLKNKLRKESAISNYYWKTRNWSF